MLAIESSRRYPVLPSAFQLIEGPLYLSNKVYNYFFNVGRNAVSNTHVAWEKFSNSRTIIEQTTNGIALGWLYSKIIFASTCLGIGDNDPRTNFLRGLYQTPLGVITLGLTPVTLVADPIIGLIEAAFAKIRGYSDQECRMVLHKKCIASPIQQGTLLVVQAVTSLCPFVLFSIFFTWERIKSGKPASILQGAALLSYFCSFIVASYIYSIAQMQIRDFPDWIKPEGFLIFINGGSEDENGRKFTEKCEQQYQQHYRHANAAPQSSWIEYVNKNKGSLSTAKESGNFGVFKENFKLNKSEEFLLGIGSLTKENILTAYKKWALVLHPDRNPVSRRDDADILFKALSQARFNLEKKLVLL